MSEGSIENRTTNIIYCCW